MSVGVAGVKSPGRGTGTAPRAAQQTGGGGSRRSSGQRGRDCTDPPVHSGRPLGRNEDTTLVGGEDDSYFDSRITGGPEEGSE